MMHITSVQIKLSAVSRWKFNLGRNLDKRFSVIILINCKFKHNLCKKCVNSTVFAENCKKSARPPPLQKSNSPPSKLHPLKVESTLPVSPRAISNLNATNKATIKSSIVIISLQNLTAKATYASKNKSRNQHAKLKQSNKKITKSQLCNNQSSARKWNSLFCKTALKRGTIR